MPKRKSKSKSWGNKGKGHRKSASELLTTQSVPEQEETRNGEILSTTGDLQAKNFLSHEQSTAANLFKSCLPRTPFTLKIATDHQEQVVSLESLNLFFESVD